MSEKWDSGSKKRKNIKTLSMEPSPITIHVLKCLQSSDWPTVDAHNRAVEWHTVCLHLREIVALCSQAPPHRR